jgi:hypothetical protein
MKKYTFEDISRADDELYQLAVYAVTKGKIIIPKNIHQTLKLQEKVAEKFNYYKQLIQDGESTVDFIQQDVLSTYGPFPRESLEGNEYSYDNITKYVREEDEREALKKEQTEIANNFLDTLAKNLKGYGESSLDSDAFDFPEEYPEDKE